MNLSKSLFVTFIVVLSMRGSLVIAEDWPGFRNADRSGISKETDLLEKWPEGGPRELWSVEGLGLGYASAAIADNVIYTTGMDSKSQDGFLFAFDLKGKQLWKKSYGPEWKRSYPGARTTPVIEDGKLYIITGQGVVNCFDAKKGDLKWEVDALKIFKGKNIVWGLAESALIYKNMVICTPGGKDASVAALDKNNGQTIWTSKGVSETSGYCSSVLVRRGDLDIIATVLANSIIGVNANTGELLWKADSGKPRGRRGRQINPNSIIYKDGYLYQTAGYGKGGVAFKLSPDGKSIKKIWEDKNLDVQHGGVVLIDGYIYGASHNCNRKNWLCLELKTGKVMYRHKWQRQGSIIAANGFLYCWDEHKGNLALVKANPSKFEIISSFKVEKGDKEFWAHPSISNGVLYLRHGDVLIAYDIKMRNDNSM